MCTVPSVFSVGAAQDSVTVSVAIGGAGEVPDAVPVVLGAGVTGVGGLDAVTGAVEDEADPLSMVPAALPVVEAVDGVAFGFEAAVLAALALLLVAAPPVEPSQAARAVAMVNNAKSLPYIARFAWIYTCTHLAEKVKNLERSDDDCGRKKRGMADALRSGTSRRNRQPRYLLS